MLLLENVQKTFNAGTVNEKKALNRSESEHELQGDFVTVIGGNGAGKSTMLNMPSQAFDSIDEGEGGH